MASGFGPKPGLLRTFHIRKDKTVDELTPIIQRAIALRDEAGITHQPQPQPSTVELDPLADIARVLHGTKRMRTTEVLQRLATVNAKAYTGWTLEQLSAYLAEYDAAPYKTGGVMQISTSRVTEALTERNQEHDLDEGEN
jgi:S-DNA-T family DNA segregation ATPase FtsK/SpoIIIE